MQQLLFLFLVLVFIVVSTAKYKIHPFLSLLIAAIIMGFAAGLDGNLVVTALAEGFGDTLGSIGIIIALGSVIGIFLEKSGGTRVMAEVILKAVGTNRSPLAMNLTGLIISIPVFCDSGFVILSPLNKALSKKSGISLVILAVSLSTGLYATHVFVPPTPGPLAAAAALEADLGIVILLGIIVSVPVGIVGHIWARIIGKRFHIPVDEQSKTTDVKEDQPGFLESIVPIIIPIILIALKSAAIYPTYPLGQGILFRVLNFIGSPVAALFAGVILAYVFLNPKKNNHHNWISGGLKEAGIIILITGAGGAFGNIIRVSDIGDLIGSNFSGIQAGIFLPFLVAAVLKSAQGSSTVSIITTAAIVAPLMEPLGMGSSMGRALGVLSIGAGAMTVSHLNDSYFWVVSQFSGMNVQTALKSHTIATLIQGITAIMIIALTAIILL
ncbi:MAG: GntP family permease [Bacteroidales bacterium]|nr:MAG: GntP family permease [Bacteroidales bacterium]